MSLVRIWAIASNGFREVIRDRILYVIGLFAIMMMIAGQVLPEISASAHDKILVDFGLASSNILGVMIAIFVGTNLVNKEIEKRTVLVLIPKPISSAELILGKHLGLCAVLAILVSSMTVINFIFFNLAKINYHLGPILVSTLFLFFQLCLITGAALMFGVFTSSILATLFTLGVYLVGNLVQDMVKLATVTRSVSFQKMSDILFLILPDLSRLDLKNQAVYGMLPTSADLWYSFGYCLIYTTLFLVAATVIFARREF
jgi:ABC-type transport system involved in multi-copper enzyme maturation permease subunit